MRSVSLCIAIATLTVLTIVVESTVSQRREMDSERQTKETEEQRRQREVSLYAFVSKAKGPDNYLSSHRMR